MNKEQYPLVMAEGFWANSPLSIVRHSGTIMLGSHLYIICNKEGKDVFQCSREAAKAGRKKAIEPGEPCDLVRFDILPIYRKLGRDKFFEFCKANPDVRNVKEIKQRLKEWQQN